MRIHRSVSLCLALFSPAIAFAQDVIQPGEAARKGAEEAAQAAEPHYNAYDAPADESITVPGRRMLEEEERIGTYKQPRWTARRRFPTTRVYVAPKGQFAVEYWLRSTSSLEDFSRADAKKYRSIYEIEMGLGHRLQLDLYLTAEQAGHGPIEVAKESIELRYALADWGEIWANPTLYFEYGREGGGAQFAEAKLLFGGEIASGLHAGLNLVLEHVLSDDETNEYKVTGGLSKTLVDKEFSIGAEVEVEFVDVKDSRFDFVEKKYVAGPSISWQPDKHMHLLWTPLFGIAQEKTDDGDESTVIWQNWIVVGWNY
ncbi:MAG: hypothetical protein H6706_26375 [Myxococcales bacterium]|nr:hypothetical protein [Myxococcales bacterium]